MEIYRMCVYICTSTSSSHLHTLTPSHPHTLTPSQLVAQAVAQELQHEQGAASVEKVVNTDDENEVQMFEFHSLSSSAYIYLLHGLLNL